MQNDFSIRFADLTGELVSKNLFSFYQRWWFTLAPSVSASQPPFPPSSRLPSRYWYWYPAAILLERRFSPAGCVCPGEQEFHIVRRERLGGLTMVDPNPSRWSRPRWDPLCLARIYHWQVGVTFSISIIFLRNNFLGN